MSDIYQMDMCRIIFWIYLVQLMLQGSSNGFSSSRTSRITFVDLAGPENDDLDGAAKNCTKEERHLKKSLSRLGYVKIYKELYLLSYKILCTIIYSVTCFTLVSLS